MRSIESDETSPSLVFCSFADADQELLEILIRHFSSFRRRGLMTGWHRGMLLAGDDSQKITEERFKQAALILLCISAEYLESEFYQTELLPALERQKAGTAHVVPILFRPVEIKQLPFVHLPCLPHNKRFVTQFLNRDEVLKDIASHIGKMIEAIHSSTGSKGTAPFIRPLFSSTVEQEKLIKRPQEYNAVKQALLDTERDRPTAITTALQGAGGFGKTTLAQMLCLDREIWAAFPDGILWVTLGEKPDNLVDKVGSLIFQLSGEKERFTDLEIAVTRLKEQLGESSLLLVIDDVWNASDIKPFIQGGTRCVRLITTRIKDALPTNTHKIVVDAMRSDEAVQLLLTSLENDAQKIKEVEALHTLAARLGEWPLLLKLANAVLCNRVAIGQTLPDALQSVNEALDEEGLGVFDVRNTRERNQAVEKTLQVSFGLLTPEEYACYKDLAIFPEDVNIPLVTVQKLWGRTGGFGKVKTEKLCLDLYAFSLLLNVDLNQYIIRLHDVIRTYLREQQSTNLPLLHQTFLDTYALTRWADLPQSEPYLWNYLAEHLIDAGRSGDFLTTVKDLRYLATKTLLYGTYAVEIDLGKAERIVPDESSLCMLKRNYTQMIHLLNQCLTFSEVATTLCSRLFHLKELSSSCQSFIAEIPRPSILPWYPLPDLPHSLLIRTLQGHIGAVNACAVGPKGTFVVSASHDATLKVWDIDTGIVRRTLQGHRGPVLGCAVSSSENYIISASSDYTLKIWNAHIGDEYRTLQGHTGFVNCCSVSPDEDYVVSASSDHTLKVWDLHTGAERFTLRGHTNRVKCCAVSLTGEYIVSASDDKTLKVWDALTGAERLTLRGHTKQVNGCAIHPTGDIVVSASNDKTLKVWDAYTGAEYLTLRGHTDKVIDCQVSPDGTYIISASNDKTLKIWDIRTWTLHLTLSGHTSWLTGCGVYPERDVLVSASLDETLKIWNIGKEASDFAIQEYTERVQSCAISPTGDFVVLAQNNYITHNYVIKMWKLYTEENSFTLYGHDLIVSSCTVSPHGNYIVSASLDTTLKVWDIMSGTERFTLKGHTDGVNSCAVSPGGDYIISASDDSTLKIWDAYTGKNSFTLRGHMQRVNSCAVSPGGDYIISASDDSTLKIWDARTGTEKLTLPGHTQRVNSCAVSPKGDYIISASNDHTLKAWDTQTWQERFTLLGHQKGVNGCAISPSGDYIVSVSTDQMLKVWNAYTGVCLTSLLVDGSLLACAFHPDNEHIIACGERGMYFLQLA